MLNVKDYVPNIYVKGSRDFQLYCNMLQVVINSTKFNIDSITNIYNPLKCNNRTLDLLCTVYNYQPKRKVSDHDLRIILSNYANLMKYKGTLNGIKAAVLLTVKLTGKDLEWDCSKLNKVGVMEDSYKILVNINGDYDHSYLREFMDLVAPVGYLIQESQSIIRTSVTNAEITMVKDIDISSAIDISVVASLENAVDDNSDDSKANIDRVEVLSLDDILSIPQYIITLPDFNSELVYTGEIQAIEIPFVYLDGVEHTSISYSGNEKTEIGIYVCTVSVYIGAKKVGEISFDWSII